MGLQRLVMIVGLALLALGGLVTLQACGSDESDDSETLGAGSEVADSSATPAQDGEATATPDITDPPVAQGDGGSGASAGATEVVIDARSEEDWVYFDLSAGAVVSSSHEGTDWDLAFRRTDVLTNSGDTNPSGTGGAIDLGEIDLGEAGPPDGEFLADVTHEERGIENPALHTWYNYDWTTHVVTSKGHTYAVRTTEGAIFLIRFDSYYCEDESADCVTFQYEPARES